MENEEGTKPENNGPIDAVDALSAFIETECIALLDRESFVDKVEFRNRFEKYCIGRGVEPPSPGLLGSMLVNLYLVWGDTIQFEGQRVHIWRNITLKSPGDERGEP
jgi:hypothetical protein